MPESLPEHVRESLDWHHREHDAKSNERGTPPASEEIYTHCVWGVEFYPPAYAERLSEALLRLGWTPDRELPHSQTPSDWIEHARARPYGTSWRNLGFVAHESDSRWWSEATKTRLPTGVSFANAYLHQIIPSHTALVMQFTLIDELAATFERILRRRYRTEYRPSPGRSHFATPENQKQEAIQAARGEFRSRLTDWFSTQLPGLLSVQAPELLPVVEFTTLSSNPPFYRSSELHYLWHLEMDHDFDAWQSETLPGLRVAQLKRAELPYYLVFGGHKPTMLDDEQLEMFGGPKPDALVHRLTGLHSWIVRWALQAPLGFYERQAAQMRDRSVPLKARNLREWSSVAEESVELRRDALPFAGELKVLSSEPWFHAGEGMFTMVSDHLNYEGTWLESLGNVMNKRADILDAALQTSAETITLGANVMVAKTSILLTVALVVLSVILLVISA